jgi:S-adenosylmethionine decarboxylase
MALDIYTCGVKSMPFKAVEYVLQMIDAKRSHITEITRGLDDNDQVFYHSFITWEEILKKNGNPSNP